MFRYIALLWNVESARSKASAEVLISRISALAPRWELVLREPGLYALVADRSEHLATRRLSGGRGVVLGEMFRSLAVLNRGELNAEEPVGDWDFGESETKAVLESEGRFLVSHYWGNYVALLSDVRTGARLIFKGPCGTMPCHFVQHEDVQLVFSSLGDCRELGMRFRLSWEFVRARIASGSREVREPSLVGVSTVYRGECIRFNRQGFVESRTIYWQPRFSESDLDDPEAARRALHATVHNCVRFMAARHPSVLAQVSGGLDSSIVLGALSAMPGRPKITCYTFFMPDSVCDERRWARQAAERGGFQHVEVALEPRKLIYRDMPALAASTEPGSYFSHWQKGPVERELATRYGASTVFTGEGGDSAFCATSFVFSVDHCLRRFGLGFRTFGIAARVATRRDRTVWNVLGNALRREMFGDSAAEGARSVEYYSRLVSPELRRSGSRMPAPVAGSTMNFETLLRMGPLAFVPSFYDLSTSHHDAAPDAASPLCAQPVVELCARIPVDVHFDGSLIRGLARKAFSRDVPQPILRRQWKDRPLLQLGEVIQRNLKFIREHLLEGRLAKERILDRGALERALGSSPSNSSAINSEIVSHLDLELWIRDSS
jgi:asparagine synthase (glutamine-hydrolysing)